MNKYNQEVQTPAIVTRSSYAERQFLHTFLAGVLLPLSQAFATGLIIFIVTFTLAVVTFDALDPFTLPLTLGIVTLAITYLYLQRRWLTLTAERAFNVDLNNDHVIGEPEPQQTVRIQLDDVRPGGHFHRDIIDLPVSRQKLTTLAAGLLNGLPFSEKQWTPTKDGKLFSSQEFRSLKTEMLKRGLMVYVNPTEPRQGITLTKPGPAAMKYFVSPSPTPQAETDEN